MRYKPKKFGLYKRNFTTTDGITVKEENFYKNWKKHGISKEYWDGKIYLKTLYQNDKIIEKTYYKKDNTIDTRIEE